MIPFCEEMTISCANNTPIQTNSGALYTYTNNHSNTFNYLINIEIHTQPRATKETIQKHILIIFLTDFEYVGYPYFIRYRGSVSDAYGYIEKKMLWADDGRIYSGLAQ